MTARNRPHDQAVNPPPGAAIAAAIIAGGAGRRMGTSAEGRDKPMRLLAGRPLIEHVVARMQPQARLVAINANGDPDRFAGMAVPVIADRPGPGAGPLRGIATMLDWAAGQPQITHLATAPADCPFLPRDLVERLAAACTSPGCAAVAASGGRTHPLCGLWPVTLAPLLENHLHSAADLSIRAFLDRIACATVEFPFANRADPFFNINRPEDLETAERILANR
ncbi:molybdenum cofactor guanylyltransferase MobA [Pseudohoeflea coraliihabitans]|uniref:Molybdenum cofactor guanylyltransferase n=1 Tax=Pseudohoeflea coraliihabitans TaxID=2860393 RepID=A0ABS6WSH2_9HYPH|nr:molybdenum cofactor guanylyltransferase MobA [Pseudohoeflea sp. DP4N28-3]MBW3098009.1 molybdenum cofactor guanylyltransferase [Pseudohoeflea sp. DP4N28-3]